MYSGNNPWDPQANESHYAGHDDDNHAGYEHGGNSNQPYQHSDADSLYSKGDSTDIYSKFQKEEIKKNSEEKSEFDELVEETAKKVIHDESPTASPNQDINDHHFIAEQLKRKEQEALISQDEKREHTKKKGKKSDDESIEDHILEAIIHAKNT